MYELVEAYRGRERASAYATLEAAVEALAGRATAFLASPGATVLRQRPRSFAGIGPDGERLALSLRSRAG